MGDGSGPRVFGGTTFSRMILLQWVQLPIPICKYFAKIEIQREIGDFSAPGL